MLYVSMDGFWILSSIACLDVFRPKRIHVDVSVVGYTPTRLTFDQLNESISSPPQVAPAEGFADLAFQVMMSPSKNYILLVIALAVCVLFLVGLLCGRITKRVTRELKDR